MEDGRYFDSIFIKSKKSKTKVKRNEKWKTKEILEIIIIRKWRNLKWYQTRFNFKWKKTKKSWTNEKEWDMEDKFNGLL